MHIARETAGAARTRSSLRPLFFEGKVSSKTPGASRRENAELYSVVVPANAGTHTPRRRLFSEMVDGFFQQSRFVVMGPGLRRDDGYSPAPPCIICRSRA